VKAFLNVIESLGFKVMASEKWQNRTVIDMWRDREREAWYFRILAITSASLILLG
jgi:phage terminase large subunit-like protein